MQSRRRVAGVIRSLVNARDLQLQCDRVLHETMIVLTLVQQLDNVMEGGGDIQIQVCTDGHLQRFAKYQEDGQIPKCMDKGVMWSDEGDRLKD